MAQITMENVVYVQHTPAPAQILIPYFFVNIDKEKMHRMRCLPILLPYWSHFWGNV